MKTAAAILAFVGAAAAMATGPIHMANVSAIQGHTNNAATPDASAARFYFNLISSDGNYLGQDYASEGAYLTSSPSGYYYTLNAQKGLDSSSTDHLDCFGGGGNTCVFAQSAGETGCKITGTYPNYAFSCAFEKSGSFGNGGGYLYYGTTSELAAVGAKPIKFTVVPCSC